MNFGFLASKPEYALFSDACIEAERTFTTSPAMCVVGCRKALELVIIAGRLPRRSTLSCHTVPRRAASC